MLILSDNKNPDLDKAVANHILASSKQVADHTQIPILFLYGHKVRLHYHTYVSFALNSSFPHTYNAIDKHKAYKSDVFESD